MQRKSRAARGEFCPTAEARTFRLGCASVSVPATLQVLLGAHAAGGQNSCARSEAGVGVQEERHRSLSFQLVDGEQRGEQTRRHEQQPLA